MKVCFVSSRPFADGPVVEPIPENDQIHIAYLLGADYISFYSVRRLSRQELTERFRQYSSVWILLDLTAIELVLAITEACAGRVVTYSEGHVSDYQRLTASQQVSFVKTLRSSSLNLLYWRKYISFYRSLTPVPVDYLPLPYPLDLARRAFTPYDNRPPRLALPTGLAGQTRNGLASMAAAKRILQLEALTEVSIGLDRLAFDDDAKAVAYFLLDHPFQEDLGRSYGWDWRAWIGESGIDYRWLIALKRRLRRGNRSETQRDVWTIGNARLYPRKNWMHYLAELSQARLMVDLNNRETVGRNAMDCAALGVPCVSTNRSDLQEQLFPELTLEDSWDIEGAVRLSERVIIDIEFQTAVIGYAWKRIKELDLDRSKARLVELLKKHRLSGNNPNLESHGIR